MIAPLLIMLREGVEAALIVGITTLDQELEKYKTPNGSFVSYDKFSEADRQNLKTVLASLFQCPARSSRDRDQYGM